ncbi:MAG: hypothetical protein Q8L52_02235 [bacterium]|nr:hypothetical protein [bacterium]
MHRQAVDTVDVEEFNDSVIPGLIGGKSNLRILFSTYNEVHGYDDGKVETEDPNLEIVVTTGGVKPESFSSIFRSMTQVIAAVAVHDFAAADRELDLAESDARRGQDEVKMKLAEHAESHGYPDIAVVYAGLSAFASAVDTVKELHKRSPGTFIAVLTCDCDLAAKKWELGTVDGIGATIVTPHCGGRGEMRDILEAFVAQWPRQLQ